MDAIEIANTLASMSALVEKHGAEKTGKVIECLTDLHATLSKYDEEIRNIAIHFVINEASK